MSLFFYGTLCHPAVLERVTGTGGHVYVPAVLSAHTRLRVKQADYPGVVPHTQSASVEGMLVNNLSHADIARLDLFEGDEYIRKDVEVVGLKDQCTYKCQTYIFLDSLRLETEQWDFATFVKEKLHFWTGEQGEKEYDMLADGTGGRSKFV